MMKYFGIADYAEVCANCKHYYQHYTEYKGRYNPTYFGHCAHPRLKTRKPDETCARYERAYNAKQNY